MNTNEEIHAFNDELENSKKCYPEVIPLLNKFFDSSFTESPLAMDKLGSDLSDGKIHIDVKYNWKYSATNFICEHPTKYSDGWLYNTNSICDYLCWWCTDKIILIDFKDIQKRCIALKDIIPRKYYTTPVVSKGFGYNWKVIVSLIPMNHIKKDIVYTWDRK